MFDNATHQEAARQHLAANPELHLVGLLYESGHTEFLSVIDEAGTTRWVRGRDVDGTPVVLEAVRIAGYYLTERQDAAGAPSAEWQAAFMALRAACDESADPKVKEAAARLDRLEAK